MNIERIRAMRDRYRDQRDAAQHAGRDEEASNADALAAFASWHLRRAAKALWPVLAAKTMRSNVIAFDPRRTLRGVQSPIAAWEAREEAPFPLVKVRRLPRPTPVPRAVRVSPANDGGSLFVRALTWTLKHRS